MVQLTQENFKQEVMESTLPVIVDFWAPWCGPCKMIAPLLDDLAKEYGAKMKFAKLNVDDCPQLATNYGVMSIPTFMFFKNGRVHGQSVGAVSRQELKKKIEGHLS